jgi:hypothetical protein
VLFKNYWIVRVTSLHYVQRSFILDMFILSIDWISTVLSHTGEAINALPPVPLQDCAVLENHAIGFRIYEDEWRPLQGVHGGAQAPSSRLRVGGVVQLRGRHRQIFYPFYGDEPYWIVRVVLPRPN